MDNGAIELSHNEISLLVFAIEGGNAAPIPDASSCEEACPVVESVEELLCGGTIDPKQQLVRHLNNHLREGLIECGMFELMAAQSGSTVLSADAETQLQRASEQLAAWTCQIKLDSEERRLLHEALSRLPRSSWITMPKTMWRLSRKLKLA
jgi:hypothetical protein